MNSFLEKYQTPIIRIVKVVGWLLAILLLVLVIGKIKAYRYIGSGEQAGNTITVTGQGKVEKAPDTAKVSFTIQSEQKDVKAAQDEVSKKVDAVKKDLIAAGVDEKYIKTDSYTSYPQYDYPQPRCLNGSCSSTAPVLRGYEVSHSITVSIKNLESVETVLGILGKDQVTNMQGPNFGFEDDKEVAREARDLAIKDAREEAKKLASSLGVHLVRIVSFNESGSNAPVPMFERNQAMDAKGGVAAAPSVPVGVQNVQSNVTVVYEIR